MPDNQQGAAKKVLGGSLFLKIIVIAAIGLIIFAVLGASKLTPVDIFMTFIKLLLGALILALVFKGITSIWKPTPVSPNEDFRRSLTKAAIMRKPFNIKKLFIRGEDMFVYSFWFFIKGCLFLPYLSAKPKIDEKGNPIYIKKLDERGKPVKDKKTGEFVMVQEFEKMTEKDGEMVFVGSRAPWWQFWNNTTEIVRAHLPFVSDIGETVWIKTPNLVEFNGYFYPCQQWQDDIIRIVTQNKNEALLFTFKELLDLPAQAVRIAIGSDPNFQKMLEAKNENLGQQNAPLLLRG